MNFRARDRRRELSKRRDPRNLRKLAGAPWADLLDG
jgi:hypothetical protein